MSSLFLYPAILFLALVTALPAAAQTPRRSKAPATSGELLAQSCFACHGPKGGSSSAPLPSIGGQNEAYLINALTQFKEGNRPATLMTRLMKAYTPAEIGLIAHYLAEQPFYRPEQVVDAAQVHHGERIYQRICKDCHLNGGRESSESEYPKLAGQWLPYLQLQIDDIVAGKRPVDDKFQAALRKLSREEIDSALHYFAAQR